MTGAAGDGVRGEYMSIRGAAGDGVRANIRGVLLGMV